MPSIPTALNVASLRWIAFDLVGTLVYPDPPVANVYGDVGRRYGSQLSDDEIRGRFSIAFRQTEDEDFGDSRDWTVLDCLTTDEARERQRWERIVGTVLHDVAEPQPCFQELFDWFGRPDAWRVYSDAAEVLAACTAAGYRLALASNYDARLHTVCDGLPELTPIRLRVISSKVGYRKPSLNFYRGLLRAADCRPHEMLMIGDDPINDIEGARRAGLPALRIERRNGPSEPAAMDSLVELRQILGI